MWPQSSHDLKSALRLCTLGVCENAQVDIIFQIATSLSLCCSSYNLVGFESADCIHNGLDKPPPLLPEMDSFITLSEGLDKVKILDEYGIVGWGLGGIKTEVSVTAMFVQSDSMILPGMVFSQLYMNTNLPKELSSPPNQAPNFIRNSIGFSSSNAIVEKSRSDFHAAEHFKALIFSITTTDGSITSNWGSSSSFGVLLPSKEIMKSSGNDKILDEGLFAFTHGTSGYLFLGAMRIFSHKVEYLLLACNQVLPKAKQTIDPKRSLTQESALQTQQHPITFPENWELNKFIFKDIAVEKEDQVLPKEEIMLNDLWANVGAIVGVANDRFGWKKYILDADFIFFVDNMDWAPASWAIFIGRIQINAQYNGDSETYQY
uniref:Uncharacterized protein n=1 Tax=Kalanchoe fedtschenkoi TaxID=63787 RepID=A0A7N0TZA3_KALFE